MDAEIRRQQDQLRRLGLPMVLEPSVRSRALLKRTAPVMLFMAVLLTGSAMLNAAVEDIDIAHDQTFASEVTTGLVAKMLVATVIMCAAPLVWWLAAVLVRRVPEVVSTVLGALSIVAVLLAPVVANFAQLPGLVWRVLLVACLLFTTYLGLGSMTRWAAAQARRQVISLVPMISRVLPTIALATLFSFFNIALWRVLATNGMRGTFVLLALFAGLTMILIAVNSHDEVGRMVADDSGHPLTPLRRAERFNVDLVAFLMTTIQVVLFWTVTFGFFVLLGVLAVRDETVKAWTGADPQRFGGLLNGTPLTETHVSVAMILAAFSAMMFAASASSNAGYRGTFIAPLLVEVKRGLEVRDAYLGRAKS